MNATDVQVFLSMALALIFLASAVPKLLHPRGFILAVLEYRVLPPRLGRVYARLLPPLELLLALLLLSGTSVRLAAIGQSVLLLSFLVAVSINLARGRTLDCHCFGKARRRPIGWGLLLQDGALLGASLVLAVITRAWVAPQPWSVFRLLGLGQAAGPALLLGCTALTGCAVALLGLSASGMRQFGSAGVRKPGKRRGGERLVYGEGNHGGRPQWERATSSLNGGSE
jgi:hypothetical protein